MIINLENVNTFIGINNKHSAECLIVLCCKRPVVNILGYIISVLTIHLYYYSVKATINNKQMNGHDCIPVKLYL